MVVIELVALLLEDAFWAAIPAVGFAMVFNVPPHTLVYCAIGGALAHSLRTGLMHFGIDIEWATLAASTTIGFIGVFWSRKKLVPRPVYTVASIIPMIPGSFAFRAMISMVEMNSNGFTQELYRSALENGLKTLFIVGALSFGLAIPSLLIFRNRPIV